jgi:hypothetical protein
MLFFLVFGSSGSAPFSRGQVQRDRKLVAGGVAVPLVAVGVAGRGAGSSMGIADVSAADGKGDKGDEEDVFHAVSP